MRAYNQKGFNDGFSWVLSAIKLSLPKSVIFLVYCSVMIITVSFTIYLLTPTIYDYFPPLVPLGIILLGFVMLLGFIKASLHVVNNNKVSFISFFFGFYHPCILGRTTIFIILAILSALILLVLPAMLLASLLIKCNINSYLPPIIIQVVSLCFVIVVFLTIEILSSLFAAILIQKNKTNFFAAIVDTIKGISINILPFFAMLILCSAITFALSLVMIHLESCAIEIKYEQAEGGDLHSNSTLLLLLIYFSIFVLFILLMQINVTATCVAYRDIFSEDDHNIKEEISQNSNSVMQQ